MSCFAFSGRLEQNEKLGNIHLLTSIASVLPLTCAFHMSIFLRQRLLVAFSISLLPLSTTRYTHSGKRDRSLAAVHMSAM